MTQNQWPQDGSLSGSPATYQTTDTYGSPSKTAQSSTDASKTDAAKAEAADVAHQAAGSAQHVSETAKAEAANVAAEVKTNARDLLHQAKSDLTDQAGTQQQKVAQGFHAISGELRTMAQSSEQPGVATDLIRQAADRSASVASWLEARDPGSLLNEAKTFARNRPGTFLLLAAGAGILAGRLTKSLAAGAPAGGASSASSAGAAARTSAQQQPPLGAQPGAQNLGAQETVYAAGAGAPFFDEPALPGTAGPVSTQNLPGGTSADGSLRDGLPTYDGDASRTGEGRHG
ncbi:hypothetical protein [Arthrobacter oryzae]|uniref:hypothetical protein n=1 Tax=Arthrobacter oryzae TaxID=409290 RepID=UPI0028590E57|nr:hypothetical protein [Arthrobacter oryzae]MDR6505133.1 hypothetical protein [Arthrobacter oryzae]